jgi:hypothetical protein
MHELTDLVQSTPFALDGSEYELVKQALETVAPSDRPMAQELARRLSLLRGVDLTGAERDVPKGPLRDAFLALVKQYQETRDAEVRLRLLELLVSRAGKYSRLFCEACIADPDRTIRLRAIRYLGEFQEPASLKPLAADLLSTPKEEQLARIESIGKLGSEDAIDILKSCLSDTLLFEETTMALARIGGPTAENMLLQAERYLAAIPGTEKRIQRLQSFRSEDFRMKEQKRRRDEFRVHQR